MSGPDRTGAADATLIADGVSLLNFLANHRSTAEYICWKLATRFVSDNPSEALVQQLANTYQVNGTDMAEVMRALLNSDEFKASAGLKVRRGFETVASYFRSLEASVDTNPVGEASESINSLSWYEGVLERHGQRLFSKATPDGYPDTGPEWVSSDGMLRRWRQPGCWRTTTSPMGLRPTSRCRSRTRYRRPWVRSSTRWSYVSREARSTPSSGPHMPAFSV